MKRNHKIIVVLLLMIFIGGIVTYINLSTNKVNADGTIKVSWLTRQKVIEIAKQEILNNVKTPSTVIFPKDKEIAVTPNKDTENLYSVYIWFDAQNEYSAIIRQNIILTILIKPDKTYEVKDKLIF
jgi:hypothetical protein